MSKLLAYRLRQMPRPRRDLRYGTMPTMQGWEAHWLKYVGPLEDSYRIKIPSADSSVERYGLDHQYNAEEFYMVTANLVARLADDDQDAGEWARRILRVLGFDWV